MIISEQQRLLLERHKDLVNIVTRCRIQIDGRDDPTLLDIMTDMRALEGIVTVRQNRPISDPVDIASHRIAELKVFYIPKYISNSDKLMSVLRSLKTVEGVDMIKLVEHDSDIIMQKISSAPIIL
jgi:nitrate reductase NapAB chaperone NapD